MNILLVQTGFLGDVILSTPVITNLQRMYPRAKISVMTTPAAKELVQYHPAVFETIVFDKRGQDKGFAGLRRMAKRLEERKFDAVFSLHKSWRTAVLLWLAKIPQRFGFREAAGSWLYTKTTGRKMFSHEVLRNLAILETQAVKVAKLDQQLFLGVPEEATAEAENLLHEVTKRGKPLVGLAPGSVWETKRWTVDGFSEVARHFAAAGFGVVVIGGPADAAIGAEMERRCGEPIVNLIGKTSLLSSAAVISQLQVLITNDSSPLHIASAMKTPVVALYCATIPEFGFSPWRVHHENVGVNGLSCRPCRRHGANYCPTGTHACQLQLSPAMVVRAAERVMDRAALHAATGGPLDEDRLTRMAS